MHTRPKHTRILRIKPMVIRLENQSNYKLLFLFSVCFESFLSLLFVADFSLVLIEIRMLAAVATVLRCALRDFISFRFFKKKTLFYQFQIETHFGLIFLLQSRFFCFLKYH